MSIITDLVMFGWIPFVLFLFSRFPARRAVIAAFLIAWLFLPVAVYNLPALPKYTKMFATCVGVLLGAALFDAQRFSLFKPSAADTPIVLWCLAPFISSMSNGLGLYDALSAMLFQIVGWGLPYFIGRLYLTDREALGDLGFGIFLGGLAYIPFCLFEMRMSPQLHRMVYGFFQHSDFSQTIRFGGYRPMVFMEHGLMLGMFMASACLIGVWLHHAGLLREKLGPKAGPLLLALLATTVLVKSTGALGLLVIGLGVLFFCARSKSTVPAMALLIVPLLYEFTRATGIWDGANLVDMLALVLGERAESLRFRLMNENILIAKALQQPLFGWGGWGRARVYNSLGEDISVTDGLWIITAGNYGLFGLGAFSATLLLPPLLFIRRFPPASWNTPTLAATAAIAVLSALYMIDTLLNAMINPMFLLSAGGLVSAVTATPPQPAAITATREPETRMPAPRHATRLL